MIRFDIQYSHVLPLSLSLTQTVCPNGWIDFGDNDDASGGGGGDGDGGDGGGDGGDGDLCFMLHTMYTNATVGGDGGGDERSGELVGGDEENEETGEEETGDRGSVVVVRDLDSWSQFSRSNGRNVCKSLAERIAINSRLVILLD